MKRIVWIDLAKIIGIYLVVLGHALKQGIASELYMRNFIYIFHMPLFFFLSGYLFSVRNPFLPFVKKNIHSLIIPYFFLNFLALCLMFPIYLHGHRSIIGQIIRIFIGDGHAPAGPAWFLLCLFWVRILAFFYFKMKFQIRFLILLVIILLSFCFPYHLYWRVDSALMAFPFFVFGNFINRNKIYFSKIMPQKKTWTYLLLFFILLTLTLFVSFVQGGTSIYSRQFGQHPLLYYIGAIIGIFMIISVCKLIKDICCFLSIIASGTIIIMALHGTFYIYLNFVFPFSHLVLIKPIVLSLCVTLLMYYPIKFLQHYFPTYIGIKKQ